ncbi:phosphatidate cytidylyltransferase [Aquincola sp. S2]|uniref:Phosphatidate cytidylyltransferase n=1 Tax=Pseudaquabacterium terrae TaxID=2732868 RepID=A0ABX2EIY0_9BURK|nr:phosphatidate cytidylyltransferase [Aquabacterium terrae]NRF68583.1 phosphatidate cytidylyltransferase [Aquabacterium terrae]
MLRQRVITAVILMAVLLPALFAPHPMPFVLFTLVLISAAGWEWARLNGLATPPAAIACGVALAVACGVAGLLGPLGAGPAWPWWLGVAVWVLGGAAVLRGGPVGWPAVPAALRVLIGLALLWLGWWALANARVIGINFLLSVLCIVWAADIAAYFGGRAFGKRKLAPAISPGKSWEGVFSGMAGVLLLAALWLAADQRWDFDSMSLFTVLSLRIGLAGMAIAALALAGLSVVGDLFESLVKRAAGAKDSSHLLPGHGGVLDRVDALLPVLPVALALAHL